MEWFSVILLFAEGEQPRPQAGPELISMLPPVLMAFAVFYFVLIRPQKREQANRQAMLETLKKNDKVVTIGGMIGTVANISEDGKEVTLKIDEGRVRMVRSSIQSILNPEAEAKKAGGSA
jgi:preprotein translocase subunit YajC